MGPKTSRDLPGPKPRKEEEREMQNAVVEDTDENDAKDRDLVHGEGGTLDLPVKPGDMSKDD
jgi:hypothetical protein